MAYKNELALAISEGVLATFTNLLLFSLFWIGSSVGKSGSRGAYRAFEEAFEQLGKVNYTTIKRAFYRLKALGFIEEKPIKDQVYLSLTLKGVKRLQSLLPQPKQAPQWTGDIFMVTYDIAEDQRETRDSLRWFLRQIGCVRLQKSVWLTLYDPSEKVGKFMKKHDVSGTVIVSQVNKKMALGDHQVKKLIQKLYKVELINNQYQKIITKLEKERTVSLRTYLRYLSIVKADPCLPKKLLPESSLAERAHQLFDQTVKKRKMLPHDFPIGN